jgi:hypothetical protein
MCVHRVLQLVSPVTELYFSDPSRGLGKIELIDKGIDDADRLSGSTWF